MRNTDMLASEGLALTVNGEPVRVRAVNVTELLAVLGHEGGFVAVAINRTVIPRGRWLETRLSEGDRIEIVTPRQGG